MHDGRLADSLAPHCASNHQHLVLLLPESKRQERKRTDDHLGFKLIRRVRTRPSSPRPSVPALPSPTRTSRHPLGRVPRSNIRRELERRRRVGRRTGDAREGGGEEGLRGPG